MPKREIIRIDEAKCNGCGQCVVDCAEAALRIENGKAKLIREIYCDGLGACLGACPTGALTIEQRDSEPFDEEATSRHIAQLKMKKEESRGCPGASRIEICRDASPADIAETRPELSNWPVQLKLAPVSAPFFAGADLLIAADCTAFSTVNFQGRFLKGKKLLIACPKLDDAQFYLEKISEIFAKNSILNVTVLRMEVPCCGGLAHIVKEAIRKSGKNIPYTEIVLSIKGEILSEGDMPGPKLRGLRH